MKFEELYPNFLSLTEDDQLAFMQEYIDERAGHLATFVANRTSSAKSGGKSTGGSKSKGKQVKVTTEELALLKKLGLITE